MKNAKQALSLLISAAALVGMVSCGGESVTSKKNVLVNYETVDANGEKVHVDYTTNDLLIDYLEKDTSSSIQEYYDIVYGAVVKKYFNLPGQEDALKSIKQDAKLEVKGKKDQAEKNAKEKKTEFEDEWKAILDSELSDLKKERRSEKKLEEKYTLEKMKEKISDIFYDTFKDHVKPKGIDEKQDSELTEEERIAKKYNIFWGENGYLSKRLPYHVKHILIKNTAANGSLYNGQITAEEAKDLSRIIGFLANGESFSHIASTESQDEGSKKLYGDLGIMDTATSFVNEFKLSAYIYDTLFNTDSTIIGAENDPFNIGEENLQFFMEQGIAEIPFGAVQDIGKYADITEDKDGKKVNDGNALYYPRNILFNKYFNSHNFGFITATKTKADATDISDNEWEFADQQTAFKAHKKDDFGDAKVKEGSDGKLYFSDIKDNGKWSDPVEAPEYKDLIGPDKAFREVKIKTYSKNEEGKFVLNPETEWKKVNALCDENGHPLLVVRAGTADYQGLHLISIERSGLANKVDYPLGNGESYPSTLNDYYAAINPFESENGELNEHFPSYTYKVDGKDVTVPQKTYINQLHSTYNTYNQRVNTLKNTIKNFDPSYDKKVYNWLMETVDDFKGSKITITINDVEYDIKAKLDKFVNQEINEQNATSFKISSKTWDGYVDYLQNQQQERSNKLIPEICAMTFVSGEGYKYVCNYSKEK